MNPIYDATAIRMAQESRSLCEILATVFLILQHYSDAYGPTGSGLDLLLTNNPTGVIQDLGGNDIRPPMTAAQLQNIATSANAFLANAKANGGALQSLYALFATNLRSFTLN